ncbi:hypothetical protein FRC18_010412 [Serendipita sp. 400]|nr:hypothetical protein FRC18_010412 [Serendipita sp. 400]
MRVLSVLSIVSLAATLSAALPIHGSTDTSGKHGSIALPTEAGKEGPIVAKLSNHDVATSKEEELTPEENNSPSRPHLIRRDEHDDAIADHTNARANLQAVHQTLHDDYRAANRAVGRAKTVVDRERKAGTLQQHHIDAHTNASAEARLRYNLLKENEHWTDHHTHMIEGHTREKSAERKFTQAANAPYPESLDLADAAQARQDAANRSYGRASHSAALARHSRDLINNP